MDKVLKVLIRYYSQGTRRMRLSFIANKCGLRYWEVMYYLSFLSADNKIKYEYDKEYVVWEIV